MHLPPIHSVSRASIDDQYLPLGRASQILLRVLQQGQPPCAPVVLDGHDLQGLWKTRPDVHQNQDVPPRHVILVRDRFFLSLACRVCFTLPHPLQRAGTDALARRSLSSYVRMLIVSTRHWAGIGPDVCFGVRCAFARLVSPPAHCRAWKPTTSISDARPQSTDCRTTGTGGTSRRVPPDRRTCSHAASMPISSRDTTHSSRSPASHASATRVSSCKAPLPWRRSCTTRWPVALHALLASSFFLSLSCSPFSHSIRALFLIC